jgi:hypothetical protein
VSNLGLIIGIAERIVSLLGVVTLAATYKTPFMYFLINIHINNQSTLYKVNGVVFFVNFGAKILADGRKFVQDENGITNSPQPNKFICPNLSKLHNLYILNQNGWYKRRSNQMSA